MKEGVIYFNTVNRFKWEEFSLIGQQFRDVMLRRMSIPVVEVNSLNILDVGRSKVLRAFERCHVPVFVEHGALEIKYLRDFPGPLSKPFWDTLAESICDIVPDDEREATARSVVAYCDGRTIVAEVGEVHGSIAKSARGKRAFQWDPIFVPDGEIRTFAEMSVLERMKISQAAIAFRRLLAVLGASEVGS